MDRSCWRRSIAVVVTLLVVTGVAGVPLAAVTAGTTDQHARAAAAATTGATPHGGPHIDFTSSLTPDRPGEIGVVAEFTVPDDVTSLTTEIPEGAEVTDTDGFSRSAPRQYEWTRTTRTPSLTYRLPVNETVTRGREGAETSGFLYVDTGAWALMKAPRLGVTYSGTGQRQPIRTDQSVDGPGVAGDGILFLGPVETRTREVAGQRIRLAVPEAADLRESRADVLDSLAGAARTTTLGPADDEVLAIAAPTDGVEYGSTGLQRGPSAFWVRDVQRLDSPENVWVHEYVHTRQEYRPTAETRWSYEGMADHYAASRALRAGRINYSQFRRHLRIGTRERYADVTLAEPDTWRGTSAHYWKGALAFAAIDREIRLESDGSATLQDAIRRAQDRTGRGQLDQSTFLESVEAVGGPDSRAAARRFTETTATPETWNRSAHARVFGGLASIDYRFDGFRAEGPYRSTSADRPPTLVPGERLVVNAVAANTGDTDGEFAVTLRVGDRAVGTRSGQLAAGAETDLRWTVPFDSTGERTLVLGESDRSVTVRPPATPRVTDVQVPDRAAVGESVEVRAVVTNRAERPANGTVALTTDDRSLTETGVRLASGESTTLEASTSFEASGEYTVAAGDRSTTLRVRDTTATPTPAGSSPGGGDRSTTAADGSGTGDSTDAGDGSAATDAGTGAGGADGGTDTTTATPLTPSGSGGDGFGATAALVGLLLTVLLLSRRR
jgi:PGF-CTERM protein